MKKNLLLYGVFLCMDMYEKSVGRNATLIIGLTPDPDGLLPAGDEQRLKVSFKNG